MAMDYKKVYTKDYFSGKNSFFWRFGYGKFASFYFDNMFKPLFKYINKFRGGNVLDVGCAYGFMLQRFPDSFKKFGIDVSEYAINTAKKSLPSAAYNVGSAENKLPFKKDFFDIILFNDVIEHLENPKVALENIYRVLKKGGILYVTTPNLNIARKKIFRYADDKEHHISLFSHPGLIKLLNDSQFKIMEGWTFLNFFVYFRFRSNIGTEQAFIVTK